MTYTDCYQCGIEIQTEELDLVHQLCKDCDKAFDEWFASQLKAFDKAGGKLNGN